MKTGKTVIFALVTAGSVAAWSIPEDPQMLLASIDLEVGEIINESYHFLRDREPEMTDNEYALYEQVLPMVFDQPEFALTLLETLLADEESESPAFAFALANVYFSSERYELAEKYYLDAVERFPEFMRCWSNLATLYYSQERYRDAIPAFVKAVELGNREAQTLGLLGYCLKYEGKPVAAEAAFQQAFAVDPLNSDWIEALYATYMDAGDYSRARLLAKQLVDLQPDELESWMYLVNASLAAGDRLDAIVALDIANGLGLTGIHETLLLGDLLAENQQVFDSIQVYEQVLKTDPSVGGFRILQYVGSLIARRDLDRAEEVLLRLENELVVATKMEWMKTRIQLEMERKQWSEVISFCEQVLATEPMDGEALFHIARAYRETEQLSKAEFFFEQSCRIEDFRFLSLVELANLAVKQNRLHEAIGWIHQAAEIEHRPELETYLIRVKALLDNPSASK